MARMDFHIHSDFSDDGSAPVADIVSKAMRAGLSAIGVVDHVRGYVRWLDEREEELSRLRGMYGDVLEIYSGAEVKVLDVEHGIDIDPRTESAVDFVVASFHGLPETVVQERSHAGDGAVVDWWCRSMRMLLECGGADVIGHPDRVLAMRGMSAGGDELEDLLARAEASPLFLEWNPASMYPDQPFVKRLAERGAGNIVLASDAHSVEEMADAYGTLSEADAAVADKGNAAFLELLRGRRDR